MFIYEPVIGNKLLKNIQDYPELIKFINSGGVVINEKLTANTTEKVKLTSEKSGLSR
ncbi:unknown [Brachyspira sp. CAG:484]|nr:unknown [Brachyspira sp. CAG:484]DAY63869.1 MAG TPA: hypothetical protein [Caudoviricetes sp.]